MPDMPGSDPIPPRRTLIFTRVTDLAGAFLWDDRKEDEELPRGAIEAAVAAGEITEAEIVDRFAAALREWLAGSGSSA